MFVGVGAIVIDDSNKESPKILLLHRIKEGIWELPGGKIDDGELPEAAVLRELQEETNIEAVGPVKEVGNFPHWGRLKTKWWLSLYYIIPFRQITQPMKEMAMEPHLHDLLEWFTFDNLPPLDEIVSYGVARAKEYLSQMKAS